MADGGGGDYSLQNILTNLAVRVGQFEGTLETFMKQWRDQDNAAMLSRRVLSEKIELLSLQVERLSNDLANVQQDLAELKNEIDDEINPVVDTIRFARERKAGARAAVAGIYAGAIVLISALAYIADRAVAYLTHKP